MAVRKYAAIIIFALSSSLAAHCAIAEDAMDKPWASLNDNQRRVLAPLADDWDGLRPWQRERILEIAHDYPKMSADRQERVQQRLSSWSRMTPFERENARKRFQQFKSLPPEKKKSCVSNGMNTVKLHQKSDKN